MANYWVKLYIEILDDPKMATLPDRLWRRVIELFLLAGRYSNGTGVLPDTKQLAWALRVQTDELQTDLEQLIHTGIIERHGSGGWFVKNFALRQAPIPDAERKRAERMRVRSKHYYGHEGVTKRDSNVTHDVTEISQVVTQINRLTDNRLTDTESDTDTETEADTESRKQRKSRDQSDSDKQAINNGGFSENADSEEYFSERMKPLLLAFSEATGIRPPAGGGFLTKRWHEAMLELLNQQATPEEITATIKDMVDKGLRISGPWSIINSLAVYRSKEHAKKRFVQYYDSEGKLVEVEV